MHITSTASFCSIFLTLVSILLQYIGFARIFCIPKARQRYQYSTLSSFGEHNGVSKKFIDIKKIFFWPYIDEM